MSDWVVAEGTYVLTKCLEHNKYSVFEPVHDFSDFNIEICVFGDILYVVLVIDFLRDEVKRDTHLLEGLHGVIEVEIMNVGRAVLCSIGYV